jgi:hypothetical protein
MPPPLWRLARASNTPNKEKNAQLRLLPNGEGAALLAASPRVVAWLAAVEAATAPHWAHCQAAAADAVAALRAPQAKL